MLTPGQDHDLKCAEPLLENADPDALIGDKAFDADPLINSPRARHQPGDSAESQPEGAARLRLRTLLRAQP
jgi:hypothetical protein